MAVIARLRPTPPPPKRGGLLIFGLVLACAPAHPAPIKATPVGPQALCVGGRAPSDGDCLAPREVEALLRAASLEVLRARPTPGGAQGASVVTVRAPPREGVFELKWRPQAGANAYNDPAAERIAYEAQKLVLDPQDYVIPPTVGRCLPVSRNGWWMTAPIEVQPGTGCALGYLSYWLTESTTLRDARRAGLFSTPDDELGVWSADPRLYDPQRFASDPRYRRAIAHLDVVASLIGHGDAHTGQFVMYRDPLHLFLVDNSVAFGVRPNSEMAGRQNLGARMWVPAIPSETARRIAALREDDVRSLARVDGWTRRNGALHRAAFDETVGDPEERVRADGERLQIGLRAAEIEDLLARVRRLRAALRDGELRTFDAD